LNGFFNSAIEKAIKEKQKDINEIEKGEEGEGKEKKKKKKK